MGMESHISCSLDLCYRQFYIFRKGLKNPFNEWNEKHVEQGFSFRPESIGIMTISESGILHIDVLQDAVICDNAKRILEFKFTVPNNYVEIATVTASCFYKIKCGDYKVRIQLSSQREGEDLCRISFLPIANDDDLPRYVKYDSSVTRPCNFDLHTVGA